MKLITAMIWPEKMEDVRNAVNKHDAFVASANEMVDLQNPVTSTYRGTRYQTYRHGIRVEVVVANDLIVEDVIDAIAHAASVANSGRFETGCILVTTLDQLVRIPDGHYQPERNLEAVGGISRRAS